MGVVTITLVASVTTPMGGVDGVDGLFSVAGVGPAVTAPLSGGTATVHYTVPGGTVPGAYAAAAFA